MRSFLRIENKSSAGDVMVRVVPKQVTSDKWPVEAPKPAAQLKHARGLSERPRLDPLSAACK